MFIWVVCIENRSSAPTAPCFVFSNSNSTVRAILRGPKLSTRKWTKFIIIVEQVNAAVLIGDFFDTVSVAVPNSQLDVAIYVSGNGLPAADCFIRNILILARKSDITRSPTLITQQPTISLTTVPSGLPFSVPAQGPKPMPMLTSFPTIEGIKSSNG